MKKLILSVATLALLASCNGGSQKAQVAEVEEVKSFEQEQIEAGIKMHVDSLASLYNSKSNVPFLTALKEGQVVLTDEEKQVKPEFLIDPASTNELVTLSQKYRAVALLSVDKYIAKIHDIDVADFDAAQARLVVDINDPAFDTFVKDMGGDTPYSEAYTAFYDAENEAGRMNFFWETTTAAFVEQLFAIAQYPDKFIDCFNDQDVADFTYRLILILDGLNNLKDYAPELEELNNAVQPLNTLNAITVDQFREQVGEMKEQITEVRNTLLK